MQTLIFTGAGCSYPHGEPLLKELAKEQLNPRIVTLPCHQFARDPSGLGLEDYITAHNKEVTDSETIIIGHSLGGLIAQHVAERNQNVKGIFLVASAVPDVLMSGLSFDALLAMAVRFRYHEAIVRGGAFEFHPNDLRDLFYNGTDGLLDEFVLESGKVLRDVVFGRPALVRTRPVYARVVVAENDAVISESSQNALTEAYDCELSLVEKAPHMLLEGRYLKDVMEIFRDWHSGLPLSRMAAE
jgi:predicted alpha/beta hydrolase family esterase